MGVNNVGPQSSKYLNTSKNGQRIDIVGNLQWRDSDAQLCQLIYQIPASFAYNTHPEPLRVQSTRKPEDILLSSPNSRVVDHQENMRHVVS
jgi:hypothetical protein